MRSTCLEKYLVPPPSLLSPFFHSRQSSFFRFVFLFALRSSLFDILWIVFASFRSRCFSFTPSLSYSPHSRTRLAGQVGGHRYCLDDRTHSYVGVRGGRRSLTIAVYPSLFHRIESQHRHPSSLSLKVTHHHNTSALKPDQYNPSQNPHTRSRLSHNIQAIHTPRCSTSHSSPSSRS